eukprot:6399016-Pyramimonas_sp.AAC.1
MPKGTHSSCSSSIQNISTRQCGGTEQDEGWVGHGRLYPVGQAIQRRLGRPGSDEPKHESL